MTGHATDTANAPTAYGYCCWHGGDAEDVRVIDILEPRPGGVATFACPPCRERFGLVPLADRS